MAAGQRGESGVRVPVSVVRETSGGTGPVQTPPPSTVAPPALETQYTVPPAPAIVQVSSFTIFVRKIYFLFSNWFQNASGQTKNKSVSGEAPG